MRALGGLLLCLLAAGASADETSHPFTLWRIEGQDNAVYLLGSIHMLREQDHPLPGVIDVAYDDADVLVMELDMDDLDPAYAQMAFNRAGVMTDGTTLRDMMGDELYGEAAAAASDIDVPLDMLAQSEPWLAAMSVEMMMLYRNGFNPALGVEMTMVGRATADNKPIEGLETIDEQVSFLDGLPIEAQREMLLEALQEGANIGESIDELVHAWRYGDTATLATEMLGPIENQPALRDALITSRNRRWAQTISSMLDDNKDYLVVVGALHLVGDTGVPALLATQGARVRQLSEQVAVR